MPTRDPCPGMLYRYTLLLYGTAEDMTARPTGPQVTSSACVQRDTEGLCQGECQRCRAHCWEAAVATVGSVHVAPGGRVAGNRPQVVSSRVFASVSLSSM